MKKVLIITVLAVTAIFSTAYSQYNRRFTISDPSLNYVKQVAVDVVDAGNGNSCIVSKNFLNSAYITLKGLDASGSVNFHTNNFDAMYGGGLKPTKMLQAVNGDYIVVGFYYNVNTGWVNPFAARFDNAGNNIWFTEFNSNTSGSLPGSSVAKVNVVLAADDPNESYILVAPGDLNGTTPGTIDPTSSTIMNAIKFDATGATLWNKKYGFSASLPSPNKDIAPLALAYGQGGDNQSKYFIAGITTDQWLTDRTFDMAIDGTGAVVHAPKEYQNEPGYPFGHEAIYDANTQEFIMIRTFGAYYITASVVSQIVIAKYDIGTLAINNTDMYWEDDPAANTSENYGYDIKEDATGTAYIAACFVSKTTSSTLWATTSLLKVDKTGSVLEFKRYNTGINSFPAAIASTVDAFSTENYILALSTSVPNVDVRVLSTTTNGVTCGSEDMNSNTAPYSISYTWLSWDSETLVFPDNQFMLSTEGSYNVTDCDITNPKYKSTSVAGMEAGSINVYPTMLSANDKAIHFDIYAQQQTTVTLSLYGIDGRQVATKQVNIQSGQQVFTWDAAPEAPGNYLISVRSTDGSLNEIMRIARQ